MTVSQPIAKNFKLPLAIAVHPYMIHGVLITSGYISCPFHFKPKYSPWNIASPFPDPGVQWLAAEM